MTNIKVFRFHDEIKVKDDANDYLVSFKNKSAQEIIEYYIKFAAYSETNAKIKTANRFMSYALAVEEFSKIDDGKTNWKNQK